MRIGGFETGPNVIRTTQTYSTLLPNSAGHRAVARFTHSRLLTPQPKRRPAQPSTALRWGQHRRVQGGGGASTDETGRRDGVHLSTCGGVTVTSVGLPGHSASAAAGSGEGTAGGCKTGHSEGVHLSTGGGVTVTASGCGASQSVLPDLRQDARYDPIPASHSCICCTPTQHANPRPPSSATDALPPPPAAFDSAPTPHPDRPPTLTLTPHTLTPATPPRPTFQVDPDAAHPDAAHPTHTDLPSGP
jgi:hypothetical protein